MLIRSYTDADLDQIGRVHSRSRQAAYVGLVHDEALARLTPERQSKAWRDRLSLLPDPHALFVAEDPDDGVVGFVAGRTDPIGGTELISLHVLPEQRGSGAGQALVDRMVEEFRTWQPGEAHLCVVVGNERAQAFYRRNGWRLSGSGGLHDVAGAEVPVVRYVLDL